MMIKKYKTILNDNKQNILVQECSDDYSIEYFSDPDTIVQMMNEIYIVNKLAEEYIYMLALSMKNQLLGVFEVSHGTVNSSLISPREIFIRLLLTGASNFILLHNHPSGDCIPSKDDLSITKRIKECGDMMGMSLLDHIIIGDTYFSLSVNGML